MAELIFWRRRRTVSGLRRGLLLILIQSPLVEVANKRATRMAGVNIHSVFVGVPVIRVSCAAEWYDSDHRDDWQ